MKTEYPVQWRIRELGKLCSKPQYGYTVSASMDKIGPKLLRITDITDGKLDWDKVPYCKCTDEDFSKYQLEKGDLLFARTGSTGSSILIEETPPPSVFASYLIRLKILDEISSQYLKQYFQSFDYWKQIERLKVGAVQSGINASVLYSLKVPVPPLVEQRGIAEVLGTVDTAIRVQEQIIAETESLKQGLMQQLLTKGIGHTEYKQTPIGQIPKTWDVIKYEKANKRIFVGIATSTTQYMVEYGIPLIRNQNIKEGKIDLSDLVYISKEFAKSNKSKTIKENDVLTVRTGYTGQSCKVEKEMDGWQTFTTIISRPKLDQYESDFIVHLLNSPLVRNRIQKLEAGLAQKNLNVGWISNLLIPKPPLNEQKRISKIIKDVYSDIEELEKGKTRLHFIKNGLMQVLLSGERRVELREDSYTEFSTVEKPIIGWLDELGWDYFPDTELNREVFEPFLLDQLRASLIKLNPDIQTNSDADRIINKLRQISTDLKGNRDFFNWLKNEESMVLKTGEHSTTINLIDYETPENNTYTVSNQYKFTGYKSIRPDIMLFINGIPIILIEAKTQSNQTIDYTDAINQIIRYNKQAPQLTRYLAYSIATDGAQFRYGWTNPKRYNRWKTEEPTLESKVKALLKPTLVLDFIQNFIVFETRNDEITKKIGMQQQIEATNRIIDRINNTDIPKGLIWHTQGSGKTLTMLFTAWKLKRQQQLNNPTIIVAIDRLELQRQFRETFTNVDLPYVTYAESVRDLTSKVANQSREVIITTIQKFREPTVSDPRENIIILIDEAHRTQYGNLATWMRATYPHAKLFGFTGTPIDKGPTGRSTFRTFSNPEQGETYIHKYSIRESIEDGATVRIVYQPRLTREQIPTEILDKEFLTRTDGLTEEEQEDVLRKSANLKTILKADDRVAKVAEDIAEHYRSHVEPNGFKAQLVAVDREACALYKQELDKHLPPDYTQVIYSSNNNDGELLKQYHMPRSEQLKIARQDFQDPDSTPKILIVTDMLLTGFDAPIEQVMYLDKPLRDHNLLQAIARTNRPYPGKNSAIIVDYVGIFNRLKEALNFDSGDIEGIEIVYDVLRREFQEVMHKLRAMFEGIPIENTYESKIAVIKLLSHEETYNRFKELLTHAKALYETISPDEYLSPYIREYTNYHRINEIYRKHTRQDRDSLKPYEEKTRRLIRESLILKEIEKELPTFEIGLDYLKKIDEQKLEPELEAAELTQAIRYHFRVNIELNPVLESLSEKLERILRRKDPTQLIQDLRELVKEINCEEVKRIERGLSHEENALFTVAQKNLQDQPEEKLINYVKQLSVKLDEPGLIFPNWHTKNETRRRVQLTVFRETHNQFKDQLEPGEIYVLTDMMLDYIIRYRGRDDAD